MLDRQTGARSEKRKALAAAQRENDGWVDVNVWEAAFTEHLEDGWERAANYAYANMGIDYTKVLTPGLDL